jgi:predicted amino acid-binding ACT domain protein
MMSLKLELIFKDRVGIVADISSIIVAHKLNITYKILY